MRDRQETLFPGQYEPQRRTWEDWNKDEILARLEELRKEYLEQLRPLMREMYAERAYLVRHLGKWNDIDGTEHDVAFVSAEDARRTFDTWPEVPPAEILNRNFMGRLFSPIARDGKAGWRTIGRYKHSRTPGSNGRNILCWAWRDGA